MPDGRFVLLCAIWGASATPSFEWPPAFDRIIGVFRVAEVFTHPDASGAAENNDVFKCNFDLFSSEEKNCVLSKNLFGINRWRWLELALLSK